MTRVQEIIKQRHRDWLEEARRLEGKKENLGDSIYASTKAETYKEAYDLIEENSGKDLQLITNRITLLAIFVTLMLIMMVIISVVLISHA